MEEPILSPYWSDLIGIVGLLAGVLGLLVGVAGFGIMIWQIRRTRSTAQAAEAAALAAVDAARTNYHRSVVSDLLR